jgi:2-polyprenyl-3-methyl-5-hydroxy-6-metoxy-1,4-benzoquinol methylase
MNKTSDYSSTNFDKYHCDHPFAVKSIGNFFDNMINLIALVKPSYILDIGCGEGFDIKNICEKGKVDSAYVCGLDLSLGALKVARELPCTHRFDAIQGDVCHLPFMLNRFDTILCLEVLEHLRHPEMVLRDISCFCSDYCIFSVPNEPFYRLTRMLLFKRNIAQLGDHPEHLNHWSKNGFVRLIRRYFTIDQVVAPFPWTIVLCHKREVTG